MRPSPLVLVVVLLSSSSAGADLVENFTKAVSTSDGSKLGICQQLTVHLYGAGSVQVSGNGAALVQSPAWTDAAFLGSSQPLPAAGYKVSVTLSKINFPKNPPGGPENGVTLLAIANIAPLPSNSLWWRNYRMMGIEVDATSDSVNPHPVYVNYWDTKNAMYTWSGSSWGMGDPYWKPCLSYDPLKTYTVEVEKTASQYVIRMLSSGSLLTQASVPVGSVLPATTEYLVVGDRLTSDFHGNVSINSISMPAPPGCVTPADLGPGKEGPRDASPPREARADGRPADSGLDSRPLDRPSAVDRPSVSTEAGQSGDRRLVSWDLHTPDIGPATAPPDGGCGCRSLPLEGSIGGGLLPLGLLLLLPLARRSRRPAPPTTTAAGSVRGAVRRSTGGCPERGLGVAVATDVASGRGSRRGTTRTAMR